jgi:pimeloyl-ACP methyl ester carboxylesterase
VIVEGEYRTPVQEHAYLQPEAGWRILTKKGASRRKRRSMDARRPKIHRPRHGHARRTDRIVIYPAIGGAFGGREDLSVQIVLALAAWKLKAPGQDHLVAAANPSSGTANATRHFLRAKWGATKDGKLVAVENEIIGDGGAYMYTTNKVLGNSAITSTGPYFIPNVKTDVYGVYTNNLPGAAFRGFGAPQALFMAETQMNKLAEKLGMDPVEFRLINALRTATRWASARLRRTRSASPSASKPRAIRSSGRRKQPRKKTVEEKSKIAHRARTRVCGRLQERRFLVRLSGELLGEGGDSRKRQYRTRRPASRRRGSRSGHAHGHGANGGAGVRCAFGHHRIEDIRFRHTGNPGSVSASRLTFMAGNSIKGAAEAALEKWKAEERPAIAEFKYLAPRTTPMDKETGYSMPNFQYAYVAQAAEVEVDTETGHVRVLRITSADDVGKAINPELVIGQIEGAVVQAHGYAVLEDYKTKDGASSPTNSAPTSSPPFGTFPKKWIPSSWKCRTRTDRGGRAAWANCPILPVAPAIAAAIHDATGVWIDEFPFTPERVLRALGKIKWFSVPYFIYDPTFEFLTRSGYRVLRYDLFGRGFSDRPHARYNLDLFVQQLADLLDALRLTRPLNLVGLSMGGPITAAFTARHPERVSKLVLIDPAGARPIVLSPLLKAAKIPLVAETVLGLFGTENMVRSAASDFYDPKLVEEFQARYAVQMQYRGFKRAILSTIRNDMLGSFIEHYKRVGVIGKPVLLFWGRNDTTVPFEHSDDLRAAIPNAQFHVIEDCGHIPHYEKPDEVNPILLEFLK